MGSLIGGELTSSRSGKLLEIVDSGFASGSGFTSGPRFVEDRLPSAPQNYELNLLPPLLMRG